MLKIAKEDLLRILGLDGEPELIENLDLSLTNYSAGATLAKQGADISHLYFVVFGELRLLQNVSESKAMVRESRAQLFYMTWITIEPFSCSFPDFDVPCAAWRSC